MAKYIVKKGGLHDRFRASRKKIQIIGGGFGNGKSAAACVRAIELCQQYPGCNGLIAMATYAQLNDTIREELYKWVPESAVKRYPTISDNTMIFKNGSKINLRYIKQKGKAAAADGQTSSNLLSATYDFAIVDQIENPEITYKDFLDVMGRLRGSTEYRGHDETMPSSGPRWLILTANPSFNWVYHKLIKPMKHYKETGTVHPDLIVDDDGEPIIDLFEAPTYENAHNLPADFIKGLEAAYKGQFRDRYLKGEWGAFEGLVYPEFSVARHMVPRAKIMEYLYELNYTMLQPIALRGYDYGNVVPSCFLHGFVDHTGRVFILDGFYSPGLSLQVTGERINDLYVAYYPYMHCNRPILADPAIFKRTIVDGVGKGSDTIASVIQNNFKNIKFQAGQNAKLSGIAKVASYLSFDALPHFCYADQPGSAIYFASEMSWIADEFMSYFWKMSSDQQRIDEPRDGNDHAMDTLKYMLSYLPNTSELLFSTHHNTRGPRVWNPQP